MTVGGFLGLHRGAAIDMQGELAGCHVMLGDGIVEQRQSHRAEE